MNSFPKLLEPARMGSIKINNRIVMAPMGSLNCDSNGYIIDYAKAFECVDHNKLWKILKEMGVPDHLTCLLKNLYAGPGNS